MRTMKTTTGTFPIPNDPDKGEITLKHLLPGEVTDIQEELAGWDMRLKEDADGTLRKEGEFKFVRGEKRYLWVTGSLVGWKNVFDAEGNDRPCDEANIIAVCREGTVVDEDGVEISFGEFVGRCRDKLTEQVRAAKEKAAKNS
ncbi:MAG: hypothetical protein ACLGSA_12510 [Acidobacteriota bacterium]